MELKVWCDGIQRVVCGASASTTCQDIVFALAHATGQTGRFILIEKWRNSERVLAPSDRPLTSLAKWGEYANDVTFIMKRSGDVSNTTNGKTNKFNTIGNNKSDGDLVHKRKILVNSMMNNMNQDKQTNGDKNIPGGFVKQIEPNLNHSSTLPLINRGEPFVRSISFHKPVDRHEAASHYMELGPKGNYDSTTLDRGNYSHLIYKNGSNLKDNSKVPSHSMHHQEPLYSTLSKNRPPQPPPYQEAITKSTLFNNVSASGSGIYGQIGQPIGNGKNSVVPSQFVSNGSQTASDQMSHCNQVPNGITNNKETSSSNNIKSLSSLQQETINLIDMQQHTMKSQERDITNIEQELNIVQQKLSENEISVQRYKEEMELLKQLWIEQDMLINKLESEHLEEELNQLINQATNYEQEMKEIKQNLANCENDVLKCCEQIGELEALLQHLRTSIQEKTKEIDSQNIELNSLKESIERLDETIQEKGNIIDKLVIEIKEANVEGLSLQASGLYVEEKETAKESETTNPVSISSRIGSNRKISVLPHELGSTVPTKKNPDGIWV
ncbi:hypothetical protein RDWZM_004975 [Blomia tropicalis]|uniref:Ras-associating domain-containing protein n=1 Tax=Blomia tropicalis TaxID=40697 RepID=A0A9Q0M5T9_BLOTA|nr:hypothetical protein RDWZM_004975 [Blomia tropicalis]